MSFWEAFKGNSGLWQKKTSGCNATDSQKHHATQLKIIHSIKWNSLLFCCESKSFPQEWAEGKPSTQKLLLDNAFSYQMSLLLMAILGFTLAHNCYPQPSRPALLSKWTAHAAKLCCSSMLPDNAQQNRMTVVVGSGQIRAQQKRRVWVTSLCLSTLHNADSSWRAEPAQHIEQIPNTHASHHFSWIRAPQGSVVLRAHWPV